MVMMHFTLIHEYMHCIIVSDYAADLGQLPYQVPAHAQPRGPPPAPRPRGPPQAAVLQEQPSTKGEALLEGCSAGLAFPGPNALSHHNAILLLLSPEARVRCPYPGRTRQILVLLLLEGAEHCRAPTTTACQSFQHPGARFPGTHAQANRVSGMAKRNDWMRSEPNLW
jgi:hypothetical protein